MVATHSGAPLLTRHADYAIVDFAYTGNPPGYLFRFVAHAPGARRSHKDHFAVADRHRNAIGGLPDILLRCGSPELARTAIAAARQFGSDRGYTGHGSDIVHPALMVESECDAVAVG
jgi:hypothetical protein